MEEPKITREEEGPIDKIENLVGSVREYVETRVEILKVRGIKKTTDVISTLASYTLLIVFASIFFLLLNIALGFYLGEKLGKVYYGFLALSGFYLLVVLLLFAFRRTIFKLPIARKLIDKLNLDD